MGSRIGTYPPRAGPADTASAPLSTLLSQVPLLFTLDYDRDAAQPLALASGTLRVLDGCGVPLAELAQRTGASPEMSDIGWQVSGGGLVEVVADALRPRGRVARLTEEGLRV